MFPNEPDFIEVLQICGDRYWDDAASIAKRLRQIKRRHPEIMWVIHGAAPGADTLGGLIGEVLWPGKIVPFPADWKRFRNGAGPKRNREMAEEGEPDYSMAFHPDINSSKGTASMLEILEEYGIPYDLFDN